MEIIYNSLKPKPIIPKILKVNKKAKKRKKKREKNVQKGLNHFI
jgi:hypothetical protein